MHWGYNTILNIFSIFICVLFFSCTSYKAEIAQQKELPYKAIQAYPEWKYQKPGAKAWIVPMIGIGVGGAYGYNNGFEYNGEKYEEWESAMLFASIGFVGGYIINQSLFKSERKAKKRSFELDESEKWMQKYNRTHEENYEIYSHENNNSLILVRPDHMETFSRIQNKLHQRELARQEAQQNAEKYLNIGNKYYQQKEYYQATLAYSSSIREYRKFDKGYYNRGLAYLQLEEYEKAFYDFVEVTEINEQNDEAWYMRAVIHAGVYENYSAAIKELKKAILYENKDKYRKALNEYRKAQFSGFANALVGGIGLMIVASALSADGDSGGSKSGYKRCPNGYCSNGQVFLYDGTSAMCTTCGGSGRVKSSRQ